MNKPEKNKWVQLCFVFRKKYVFVRYEDGMGNKVKTPGKEYRSVNLPLLASVRIDLRIDAYLTQMLDANPRQRMTQYGMKDIPLAIFLDLELEAPLKSLVTRLWSIYNFSYWTDLFQETLKERSYQFIHDRKIPKRPTFELPFRIALAGTDAKNIRSQIEKWNWLRNDPNTREYGLQIIDNSYFKDPEYQNVDILITDYTSDDFYFRDDAAKAPRLIIFLGAYFSEMAVWHQRYPNSSVLLAHEWPHHGEHYFLKEFLYSIIHDYPLHEAVEFAIKRTEEPHFSPILFTSVEANQALRIVDGLDNFKKTVDQYARTINPGNLEQFIQKLLPAAGAKLGTAFTGSSQIGQYFSQMKGFGGDFGRESSGLVPLSNEIQYFRISQQPQLDRYMSELKALINTPDLFDNLRQAQERVVNATMDHLTDTLRYIPINRYQPLFSGGRYRLNIGIGQLSPESLMTGKVDSIDPLLPDPDDKDGHELEVVLFSKDFILTSKPRKMIKLPLLGGSTTAQFLLEIPEELETAQLRFGIFRKNYLLQAFLLEAAVGTYNNNNWQQPATTVRMDIATSAKYTNLDEVGERDLYIGLNAGNDGTHSLFVKDDTVVREVHGLNEGVLKDAQQTFSELLKVAYFDGGYLRFPLDVAEPNREAFYDQVRKFAKTGHTYYERLFTANDKEFKDTLKKVRESSNLSFQIARHEVNYSFPWPLIYDYYLVPPAAGNPEYPVCMGVPIDPNLYPVFQCADGEGCPHNPNLFTYCIEGFWGFRHRIEQLLTTADKAKDTVQSVAGSGKNVLYANNFSDPHSESLLAQLRADLPLQEVTHACNLMELLWSEASRPSSLVVFGHLETGTIAGEPDEPRILTFLRDTWPPDGGNLPLNKWLYHRLLINKIMQDDSWGSAPLPLVFLISCYNATMTVNSLNSLIEDFYTAGASAIVGTECDITPDLGAVFIREVLQSLYRDGKDLGEAIQNFNQNCFRSYNPLAFVFTCFGNSNLKIN
ncbi:hypothetical protein VB264_15420 [Arcicella aquatica]|uniref:CHAT domain-containing protein n=1 Tax=Arcicella aquatica TaxID=217141 RepID=A0ABU5QQ26_9BACT|nr:hypothetical protein [Arcicella aquatica]MEA5259185.1 hypothetical protein [Arcicella aquatica]